MTTEIQNVTIDSKNSKNNSSSLIEYSKKMTSLLEERKGNATKPLSLRPTRSIKRNTSLKPVGMKSR